MQRPNVFALVVLIASARANFEPTELLDIRDPSQEQPGDQPVAYNPRSQELTASDSEDYSPYPSRDSSSYQQRDLRNKEPPSRHRDYPTHKHKVQPTRQQKDQPTNTHRHNPTHRHKNHPTNPHRDHPTHKHKNRHTHKHKDQPHRDHQTKHHKDHSAHEHKGHTHQHKGRPTHSYRDHQTHYQRSYTPHNQVYAHKHKYLSDNPKLAKQLSQILRPFFFSKESSKEAPDAAKEVSGSSVEILPLLPSSLNKYSTAPLALILTSPKGHKKHGKYVFNKKNKHGHVKANVEISNGNSDEHYPYEDEEDRDNINSSGLYNSILNEYQENPNLKNTVNSWNEQWNDRESNASFSDDGKGSLVVSNGGDGWSVPSEDKNDSLALENYIKNKYKETQQHKKPVIVVNEDVTSNYGQDGSGQWNDNLSTIVGDLNIDGNGSWILPYKDKVDDVNDLASLNNYILSNNKATQHRKKPVISWNDNVESNYGQDSSDQWQGLGGMISEKGSSGQIYSLNEKPVAQSIINGVQNRDDSADENENSNTKGENGGIKSNNGKLISGNNPDYKQYDSSSIQDSSEIDGSDSDFDKGTDNRSLSSSSSNKKKNVCIGGYNEKNEKCSNESNGSNESQDSNQSNDTNESKNSNESNDSDQSTDSNESKNPDPSKDSNESKDPDPSKDSNESKDPDPSKDSNESKDSDPSKDSNESKDLDPSKDSNESKDPDPSKDSNESKDPDPSKDSNESKDPDQSNESKKKHKKDKKPKKEKSNDTRVDNGKEVSIAVGNGNKLVITLGDGKQKTKNGKKCCQLSYNLSFSLCKEKE